MVRFSVLGSGSCGNSYIFSTDSREQTLFDDAASESSILVDAGYSLKQLKLRIADGGFDYDSIQSLFLTHLHPDHAHCAGTFARQTHKPVYVSRRCRSLASHEYLALSLPEGSERTIDPDSMVNVGPFEVSCFYTSHDSGGSCGYRIEVDGKVLVIITDTGVYNQEMVMAAKEADVLFLESNYDVEMLRRGPYPLRLQKRVAGDRGHLSNDQARSLLLEAGFDISRKHVYLIHLSSNNNTVELVSRAMAEFNATVCARGERYCGVV
ncbi:MAG: MBL fold metallo-hydrolase [Spirochaetales bacterium]|nr:MBL fold metallo-hydrolase [Spirochaetales bacterium]